MINMIFDFSFFAKIHVISRKIKQFTSQMIKSKKLQDGMFINVNRKIKIFGTKDKISKRKFERF